MTFDSIVDYVKARFDATQPTVESWVNERHARMVSESLYRAVKKSLGNTVAGQANYALPTDVVDLKLIRITESTGDVSLYEPTSLELLWEIDAGDMQWVGPRGLFAEDYQADGTVEIRLHPAPDTAGLAITALEALQPATMAYGAGASPIIPGHLHVHLRDGAMSDGYDDEGRQDLAAKLEARFEHGVKELRKLKNTRTGPGRHRVQIAGYDYR